MKETNAAYYIGFDIGTNSVGWAVTDENYHVLYHRKKAMWGSRLFDEALTAADRRISRTTRRRIGRRRWRIELLQDIFAEEICKVDPAFFQRLRDSRLWAEDKTEQQKFSLFSGETFNDIDFYRDYPTIYHLRKALLTQEGPFDVRLVYLALHHLVKHRGHFLFNGSVEKATSFASVYENFENCMQDEMDIVLDCRSQEELEDTLKNHSLSKRDKSAKIMEIFHCARSDKKLKAVIDLICGKKAKLAEFFMDDSLKEMEKASISFAEGEYDETRDAIEPDLQDRCGVIDICKSLYDWSVLADILAGGEFEGNSYLSVAKVKTYEKHKEDLRRLKDIILQAGKEIYRDFFQKKGKANYCAYIGYTVANGKKTKVKKCSYEELKKEIRQIFSKAGIESVEAENIFAELDNETFLPLQVSKDNGVIPYQVNEIEVRKILENANAYLPFLKERDPDGLTAEEKIIKLFKFRVPYFVGPLNTVNNKNAWAVRRQPGAIRPWNLEEKIDFEKTGEIFIRRMTNKCSFLTGKDVIPKNSLLYSEYMVWNEINNIKTGADKMPVDLKMKLFETVYKKRKKVKLKHVREFLVSEGVDLDEQALSGIDTSPKASLGSYHDFRKIFGEDIKNYKTQQMAEKLINWITVYCGDEKMLKRVIRREYGTDVISDEQLSKIVRLRYQGWGRLSRELLDGIRGASEETGESGTILYMLRNTNDNLMQLLGQRYTFMETIERENALGSGDMGAFTYENVLGDVVASPAVKRAVWQTLLIAKEVTKIMGCDPKKIFIEVARGDIEKKSTTSRKNKLLELYRSIRNSERDWVKEIDARDESEFRSLKLYLYYLQMGKCMYTGNDIDLNKITDANMYDRDHIYPQSKTKDDSLDNLVLVEAGKNRTKGDGPIPESYQQTCKQYWKFLKVKGFISQEKYDRLMRKTPLTDEELARYINRQIVETRQSSKLTAQLLKECFANSAIVYVKAKNATELRHHEWLNMTKVRSLNDFHHAKDAYLNIVAGNVHYEKFTNNPLKWLKQSRSEKYSLNRMYDFDLIRHGQIIWKGNYNGSMKTVREQMQKNDIQYTRYATVNKHGQNGGFFNQMPVSRDDNPGVPLKKGLPVEKYGGYKTLTPAYFSLVESENKKGEKIRSIEMVPLYLAGQFERGEASFEKYCKEQIGLKNPRVILPKIKKDSLLVINKFPMHLRGMSEGQLLTQGAVQLCVPKEYEEYLKKIEKYIQRNTEYKGKGLLPIDNEWDGLSKSQNVEFYEILCGKLNNTIYKYRPNNQGEKLASLLEIFGQLSCEEQCIVLNELLWFMRCKPTTTADLRMLGESKNTGKMRVNKIITNHKSAILINQSVTGLFEQKIDLLRI